MDAAAAKLWKAAAALFMALALGACATQLAPNYDKALVEGLTTANTQAMELFAAVSSGTKAVSFPSREEKYNQVIGRLDALSIQAGARPGPKNKVTDSVNAALKKRGIELLADDETPSATALKKISATLVKMRDTDRKQGVTAYEALAFKNQAAIYMDQALTYESFLER